MQDKRRVIVVMARAHPGETPSSFVCQGLLELLVSSHPIAATLRRYVVFKIVPMLNPDGVYLGNYRSNVMGADLNRCWHASTPWAHPVLHAAKDMIAAIDRNKVRCGALRGRIGQLGKSQIFDFEVIR